MAAQQLEVAIQQNLIHFLYSNACFLAERLVALLPTEHNKLLLASCYKHCNQTYRAFHLLQGCALTPEARYLLAVCAHELGRDLDAEAALLKEGTSQVPLGAPGLLLLADICRASGRLKVAAQHYAAALRKDPLMWSAYEGLCALGCEDLASEFAEQPPDAAHAEAMAQDQELHVGAMATSAPASAVATRRPQGATTPAMLARPGGRSAAEADQTPEATSFDFAFGGGQQQQAPAAAQQQRGHRPGHVTTPQPFSFMTPGSFAGTSGPPPPVAPKGPGAFPGFVPPSTGPAAGARTPTMAPRRSSAASGTTAADEAGPPPHGRVKRGSKARAGLFRDTSPAALRRSARLAAHQQAYGGDTPGGSDRADQLQSFGLANGGLWHHGSAAPRPPMTPEAQAEVSAVLGPVKEALLHLSQYRCMEALQALKRLPPAQYNTSWVMALVGRCSFEMVDYPTAARAYETMRTLDPLRVEGLEYYSTVLWHLKREVDLAHLAHESVAVDRLAPQSWCVLGNCLSLQREHEQAVRCFQRALQLSPHLAYAYSLLGHEHLASDDLEGAMTAYRNALRVDPRHYNAMYGIGQILFREEQYEKALQHFRMAAAINGRSSVLGCYQAMALAKIGRHMEALVLLQAAIASDPKNPLARYEKASVLAALGRDHDALSELTALQEVAPREASIFWQMGKLHKRLRQLDAALGSLNTALDLQPSAADAALIKSAIEKLHVSDDNEEDEL